MDILVIATLLGGLVAILQIVVWIGKAITGDDKPSEWKGKSKLEKTIGLFLFEFLCLIGAIACLGGAFFAGQYLLLVPAFICLVFITVCEDGKKK